MKIAVTSAGATLDDAVDPRFGRCPYFLIIDSETLEFEAVSNANAALGGGAGIQSAQLMADRDVKTVLTGNCGPNAFTAMNAAGITIVVGVGGQVREVVAKFKSGELKPIENPNVTSHFGMGGGGGGAGRGMGGGRGMGRGV